MPDELSSIRYGSIVFIVILLEFSDIVKKNAGNEEVSVDFGIEFEQLLSKKDELVAVLKQPAIWLGQLLQLHNRKPQLGNQSFPYFLLGCEIEDAPASFNQGL